MMLLFFSLKQHSGRFCLCPMSIALRANMRLAQDRGQVPRGCDRQRARSYSVVVARNGVLRGRKRDRKSKRFTRTGLCLAPGIWQNNCTNSSNQSQGGGGSAQPRLPRRLPKGMATPRWRTLLDPYAPSTVGLTNGPLTLD